MGFIMIFCSLRSLWESLLLEWHLHTVLILFPWWLRMFSILYIHLLITCSIQFKACFSFLLLIYWIAHWMNYWHFKISVLCMTFGTGFLSCFNLSLTLKNLYKWMVLHLSSFSYFLRWWILNQEVIT